VAKAISKNLGIEHVACNPGASFRGLQETLSVS
jgi:hypothetical protein